MVIIAHIPWVPRTEFVNVKTDCTRQQQHSAFSILPTRSISQHTFITALCLPGSLREMEVVWAPHPERWRWCGLPTLRDGGGLGSVLIALPTLRDGGGLGSLLIALPTLSRCSQTQQACHRGGTQCTQLTIHQLPLTRSRYPRPVCTQPAWPSPHPAWHWFPQQIFALLILILEHCTSLRRYAWLHTLSVWLEVN